MLGDDLGFAQARANKRKQLANKEGGGSASFDLDGIPVKEDIIVKDSGSSNDGDVENLLESQVDVDQTESANSDSGPEEDIIHLIELVPSNKQPKAGDYKNNSDCDDSCTDNEKEEDAKEEGDKPAGEGVIGDGDAIAEESYEDSNSNSDGSFNIFDNESKAEEADSEQKMSEEPSDNNFESSSGEDDEDSDEEGEESEQEEDPDADDESNEELDDSKAAISPKGQEALQNAAAANSARSKDGGGKGNKPEKEQEEDGQNAKLREEFFGMRKPDPTLEEMVIFSTQNYQFVKGYKDLVKMTSDFDQDQDEKRGKMLKFANAWKGERMKEFQQIGLMSNRSKALIYALQEVEMMPPKDLLTEIKKRAKLRANPRVEWHIKATLIFKDYLSPKFQFQKQFNPYLLFMLNNSQDELLLTYTDFCKKHFKAGLPDITMGLLPQQLTSSDMGDLKAFLRNEVLTENQMKLGFAKNLEDLHWQDTNETDFDGKKIRIVKFTDVVPFIILGFYCYVTNETEQRLARIANTDGAACDDPNMDPVIAAKRNSKTSLAACFEQAGLKREEWHQRVVSYSMTENALLFYMDKNTINTDQVELVLRMSRDRMGAHPMIRTENRKEYFDHKLPRKSFGRWLMSELALIKRMKQMATDQFAAPAKNREHFKRALVYEEKMMHTAINMDKLDHGRFTNMVTKNLLTIVHARKKFGAFLDLDNHTNIKEALMALIKTESEKALELIRREYQPMAAGQSAGIEALKKQMSDQQAEYKQRMQENEDKKEHLREYVEPFKLNTKTIERKKWEKTNKKISSELERLRTQVSPANIYKLFMSSLYQAYWHTYFRDPKMHKKVFTQLDEGYAGPTNLTHFTVHEFNEAVFFAIREFSNYVNFAQIESATFHFVMDQLLMETNNDNQKIPDDFGAKPKKQTGDKQEANPAEEDTTEKQVYPINQNGPKRLTAYSTIFVNHNNWKDISGAPLQKKYHDMLHEKKVSEFLRSRDLEKLKNIHTFGKNVVQSEVDLFRNFKLCDLEFSRFAFQILMEEAHRRSVHMMALMYMSAPRSKVSTKPDEETTTCQNFDKTQQNELLSIYYDKFKSNPILKKRELASVRETFRDQRMQRLRAKKTNQMAENVETMDIKDKKGNSVVVPEVFTSDLHYPLNHVGAARFKQWLKYTTELDYRILDLKSGGDKKKNTKMELWNTRRHNFAAQDDDQDTKKQPVESKNYDMNNILLSLNYFTGFGASILEHSKKIDADEEEGGAKGGEQDAGSRKDSQSDAGSKADIGSGGEDEEVENDGGNNEKKAAKKLYDDLENFLKFISGDTTAIKGLKHGKMSSKASRQSVPMMGSKSNISQSQHELNMMGMPGMPTPIGGGENNFMKLGADDDFSQRDGMDESHFLMQSSNMMNSGVRDSRKNTLQKLRQRNNKRPKFQFNIDQGDNLPVNAMFDEEDEDMEQSEVNAFGSDHRSNKKQSMKSEKLQLINTGKKASKRYNNDTESKQSEAESANFKGGAASQLSSKKSKMKSTSMADKMRQVREQEDDLESQSKKSKKSGGLNFGDRVRRQQTRDEDEKGKGNSKRTDKGGKTAGGGTATGETPDQKDCIIF